MRVKKIKSKTREIMVKHLGFVKTDKMRSGMPVFYREILVDASEVYAAILAPDDANSLSAVLSEINHTLSNLVMNFFRVMRERVIEILSESDIEVSDYESEEILNALWSQTDYKFTMMGKGGDDIALVDEVPEITIKIDIVKEERVRVYSAISNLLITN